MKLKRTAAYDALTIVTLNDQKSYMRISGNDLDTHITRLIKAAAYKIESHCRIAMLTQTWQITLENGMPSELELPFPPLQSANFKVEGVDYDGVATQFDSGIYFVDTDNNRMLLKINRAWPSGTYAYHRITFKCGYAQATDIPQELVEAIMELVNYLFERPEGLKETAEEGMFEQILLPENISLMVEEFVEVPYGFEEE